MTAEPVCEGQYRVLPYTGRLVKIAAIEGDKALVYEVGAPEEFYGWDSLSKVEQWERAAGPSETPQ